MMERLEQHIPRCGHKYDGAPHPDAIGSYCGLPDGHEGRHQSGSCWWRNEADTVSELIEALTGDPDYFRRAGEDQKQAIEALVPRVAYPKAVHHFHTPFCEDCDVWYEVRWVVSDEEVDIPLLVG